MHLYFQLPRLAFVSSKSAGLLVLDCFFQRVRSAVALLKRDGVMPGKGIPRPATLVDPHAHEREGRRIKAESHGMAGRGRMQGAPALRQAWGEVFFRHAGIWRMKQAQVRGYAVSVNRQRP